GAILEDGGLRPAEAFIRRTLRADLAALRANSDVSDVKSRLQNLAQSRLASTPTYRTAGVSGPDHARTYIVQVLIGDRVLGEGSGPNKRTAERLAASQALAALTGDER